MGDCCSSDPSNTEIEQKLHQNEQTDRTIKKLLLLGSGSSGKSTLFKQLRCIYTAEGLDQTVYFEARHSIRQNVLIGMMKLLTKSQAFADDGVTECKIDLTDDKILYSVKYVARFKEHTFDEPLMNDDSIDWQEMKILGRSVAYLWSLPAIHHFTFNLRNTYSMPDNMDYFFEQAQKIYIKEYMPSLTDVLKCRIKTAGMIEVKYTIENNDFHVFDVGGQRNERKKWIHSFESVCAVIFVAALNGYYSVLFEDEEANAMHESIQLFDEIINSKWFRKADIILFLNKNDLFQQLIRNGNSLKHCFHSSRKWNGVLWNGPEFIDQKNKNNNNNNNNSTGHASPLENESKADDALYAGGTQSDAIASTTNHNHTNNNSTQAEEKQLLSHHEQQVQESSSSALKSQSQKPAVSAAASGSNLKHASSNSNSNSKISLTFNYAYNTNNSQFGFDGNQQMRERFNKCYLSALDFVTERYLERDSRKRKIYCHVTTATEREVIKKVFWDVQDIVVRSNLHRTGLLN